MISMDKEYTTRDGRPVRILCVDAKGDGYKPVIGLVSYGPDQEEIHSWYSNGDYDANQLVVDHKLDLIEKKKKSWKYVLMQGDNVVSKPFPEGTSRELIELNKGFDWGSETRIAKIEWEE